MKYIKYIGIFLIVIIPSIITILIYNDKIAQDSPKYYRQGVEFYNNGDYSNAYYNFGKIKWISPLYTTAIYKQGKAAEKAGDYGTAVLKYKLFLEKNPNSIFSGTARYNLAKCYYYLKDYETAKALFTETQTKDKNKSITVNYYLGLTEKNINKEQAADYFIKYLQENGGNRNYEVSAAEELASLGTNLTDDEKLLLGKTFYNNKKYLKSLEYLSVIPMDKCWDYLILANHKAGNKVIAKKLIENGISTFSDKINKENLNKIYDIYTSYMTGTKSRNWTQMLKLISKHSLSGEDYVLYKLAQMQPKEKAITLYTKIAEKYPESDYAPDAIRNIFWLKYMQKDYQAAENLALNHLKKYKNVKSTPQIMFWLAKIYQKQNKTGEANNVLARLISKYPDDYYGLRAEDILNKKNNFFETKSGNKLLKKDEELAFPISLSNLEIKDFKLINTLFAIGDYEIWQDADFENPIADSWFEARKNKKSRSIVLARDAIGKMEIKPSILSAAYKLAYPAYWTEEINIAANKLQLDSYLITALIREESYFNEHARSNTNAIGLMQLMPSTANFMISKLSLDIPLLADLENPKINLYIGCNYLKYLKEKFNNDLYTVAAYNGGEGSVQKWINTYNSDDYDEFIENIPFYETQNYVKKVFRSYHMYKKIYN